VGKLILEHVADKNGNTLPADLTSGSYEIRDLTNKGVGHLFEGKVVYDKTYGHVTYGCGGCCGYTSPKLSYDPLGIPFGQTSANGVIALNNCYSSWDDVSDSFYGAWNTANTSIATADYYGTHTGVAVGSTSSTTRGELQSVKLPYCPLLGRTPSGGDNVVSASISQRRGPLQQVSPDDGALANYQTAVGTLNLGAIFPPGTYGGCALGFETIGTINPSIYTGYVILHRYRISGSTWVNSGNEIPYGSQDDTSKTAFRDDNPQSGSSNGRVYDLDAPTVAPVSIDGNTYRVRLNFYAYATLGDGITRISPAYYFYVRLSCTRTAFGYQFVSDVSGDNQVGSGTSSLSWNLQ
jgi:hypothetical protein